MSKIIYGNELHNSIEFVNVVNEFRNYVGFSSVGQKCKRSLWYDFRHSFASSHPLRVERLFNRGKTEESIIQDDLERAGIVVLDREREVVHKNPILRGHIDGIVKNVPGYPGETMLLEMKTANHSNFEKIKKVGVKSFSPSYWMQIQLYMERLGDDIRKCLYVVTNKNNDERLYLVYDYNVEDTTDVNFIVGDVLDDNAIPQKIGGPIWFECKFCKNHPVCHNGEEVRKSCRSCKYADKTHTGSLCTNDDKKGFDGIKCDAYQQLPVLQD